MVEITAELGNFVYIPISGLIILVVILLACASRRKKKDTFFGIEKSFEEDITKEYAIMCFPCLKKKPNLSEYEPTEDLANQFEYIVEKYTIRKVPLLLANTAEDLLERQRELEIANQKSEPHLVDENAVNFQVSQEVYNVQKVPPCITFGASTSCRNKSVKERPIASDILESMSPIARSSMSARNRNYVAIPTKASLRQKDIMMTKREITNQYLNNFTSIFVDNLKDQVPKDPEQFPRLSRPYTSAYKHFPINETLGSKSGKGGKKSRKGRGSGKGVAYAYPIEETNAEDNSFNREPTYDSESGQEQPTDGETQDTENEGTDSLNKSKSLVLLQNSQNGPDNIQRNPFKTILKPQGSTIDDNIVNQADKDYSFSFFLSKRNWSHTKNVTYEDIQALDLGYEFNSCEKLGVKPKMTRINSPEKDNIKPKESTKLAVGDSTEISTHKISSNRIEMNRSSKTVAVTMPLNASTDSKTEAVIIPSNTLTLFPTQKISSRSFATETSFLPYSGSVELDPQNKESYFLSTRSEDSKSRSLNEIDFVNDTPAAKDDSFLEFSKLYRSPKSSGVPRHCSNASGEFKEDQKSQPTIRSRSFHEQIFSSVKRESEPDMKGNDNLPYTSTNVSSIREPDTETSLSLESRESNMSSEMTSPKSSEVQQDKRATLRWKIIIKHHRDDSCSRRHVNVNKKN